MAVRIARSAFLTFVRTLQGQTLATRSQHQAFTVQVVGRGLEFVPASTGNPRPESPPGVERMLEAYALLGSLKPSDYLDVTRNASYLLTLIDLYLAQPDLPASPASEKQSP